MASRRCVDCDVEGVTTLRKIALTRAGNPVPGPRCTTHHRARRIKTRDMSWEKRLLVIYGITPDEYWAIYAHQGGVCYICRRANGSKKKLSVDHDHRTGIVRGLLCSPCNRDVLGHLRDCIDALQRAIRYLLEPPAVQVIGYRIVPNFEGET